MAAELNANTVMSDLYESDFYAWTQAQSKLLRDWQRQAPKDGKWAQLDIPNLVEEIESLGRQERQELRNRLGVLLGHLLKWEFQAERRSKSWLITIREQRRRLREHLEDNPSLKPYLPEAQARAYADGLDLTALETSLDDATFPISCPYTLEQILDPDFLPDPKK